MMKSPTSLIRNWNAVGVMLALSAVFAVVISTISMPGDRATAQVADADGDAVAARAEAWFNSLTLDQAINAILGAEADAVADDTSDPPDQATLGRQYMDATDGNNLPIEFIKAAYDAKTATQTFYDGLPADTTAESASGTANKAGVNALVDGSTAAPGDLYAVGEEPTDVVKAIRGFRSVELWWEHLTCAEARTAVGEDNNDLQTTDQDADTDGFQAEASAVCDPTLNAAGDAVESTSVKAYSDVKATADAVGQLILGLDAPGSASGANNTRAMQWWDALTSAERPVALYGTGTTAADPTANADNTAVTATRAWIASQDYADITTSLTFSVDVAGTPTALPLDEASQALVPQVKELINDRWEWVYHMGGSNDMGISELVYWWDSIGSAQRRIAVGFDNEPEAADTASFTAAGYSVDWNLLNPLTGTPAVTGSEAGKALEEQVFEVGQAILFTNPDPLPNVAAWWNTLSPDEMVYVVYGNPPMRATYTGDHDNDPDTADDAGTTVTDADKAVFKKLYADLVAAEDIVPTTHLTDGTTPTPIQHLLTRHAVAVVDILAEDGTDTGVDGYTAVSIVHALADEIFDAPTGNMGADSTFDHATIVDDNDFDWPYNSMNKAANVADWWETLDCRVMRIAVGEDNQYLDPAVVGVDNSSPADGDFDDEGDVAPKDAETSDFCAHFPGHDMNDMNDIGERAQKRVVEVGRALLNLDAERGTDELGVTAANALHAGRPSFNMAAEGYPTISGTAQVGAELTSNKGDVDDDDGVGTFEYQWFSDNDKVGTDSPTYTVQPSDVGKSITVRYSFIDGERYPESRTSRATSVIAGSPGEISRIEGTIRSVTVSAGDTVTLSVDIYGLQNVKDNSLAATFDWSGEGTSADDNGREIEYKAPSSPGAYNITAKLDAGQCQPDLGDRTDSVARTEDCEATIVVNVRRPSQVTTPSEPAQNPPGEIPTILTDADGNQYEVFTPEGGGTFTGEGYSLKAEAGAIPNGEYIGIRVSDEGSASNAGMTHQRFTLGGNMYEVSAVDASNAVISSYVLNSPATACLPLPDALRTNISDLAIVAINADDTLTILSASVRLGTSGTHVCGNLSSLPATLAVGSEGAPAPIPTPTPEPTPTTPETGGKAPTSNTGLWALLLGTAIATFGTLLVIARRRETARK